jgi:hypothetical protein
MPVYNEIKVIENVIRKNLKYLKKFKNIYIINVFL